MTSLGDQLNQIPAGESKIGKTSNLVRKHRPAASLPATTQSALFNVLGRILVKRIIGVVTTVIQTQADNTKLVANPTVGADVDLCAVNDITADAVGTVYTVTGDFSDAMVANTSGATEGETSLQEFIVEAGTIDLNCAATNTGAVEWFIEYEPLEDGACVTVA